MTDFEAVLKLFAEARVEFIVIGGIAASVHGSPRATQDLDVVYRRTDGNIERLTAALACVTPYLRGAPPGLPFAFDAPTVKAGLNFTLTTSLGDLDLLGEMAGGGGFDDLLGSCETVSAFGVDCKCLSLSQLLHAKRAAGRPKDLEVIAELEAIQEERGDPLD